MASNDRAQLVNSKRYRLFHEINIRDAKIYCGSIRKEYDIHSFVDNNKHFQYLQLHLWSFWPQNHLVFRHTQAASQVQLHATIQSVSPVDATCWDDCIGNETQGGSSVQAQTISFSVARQLALSTPLHLRHSLAVGASLKLTLRFPQNHNSRARP